MYTATKPAVKDIVDELAGSLNPKGKIEYTPWPVVRERAGILLAKKYGLYKRPRKLEKLTA